MRYELLGSMWLYLILGATSGFTPFWRRTILFAMNIICALVPDSVFSGVAFFTGALLADLSLVLEANNSMSTKRICRQGRRFLRVVWPIGLFIVALFCASYPDHGEERMAWSHFLTRIAVAVFPNSITPGSAFFLTVSGYSFRVYALTAAILLVFSLLFSPPLRHLFSHPVLVFLGSISFPVYLLHATMIRAVLVRIIYGVGAPETYEFVERVDAYGNVFPEIVQQSLPLFWKCERIIGWILWMGLLIFLANVWKNYVDVPCVQLTRWVESIMNGERVVSMGILQKVRGYRVLREGSVQGQEPV